MNKYQEAYKRLSSRTYQYADTEGVYEDIEVLGELVEKETAKKVVLDNLKKIEKKFYELGYVKIRRGHVNVYKHEDANHIPTNKNILIYPNSIACFWRSEDNTGTDVLHPCTMSEKETELALAELKAQDWNEEE